MTYDEFLEELALVAGDWHIGRDDFLRCDRRDCPITAVARALGFGHGTSHWKEAAADINLHIDRAAEIVGAADSSTFQPANVREDLLFVCKL